MCFGSCPSTLSGQVKKNGPFGSPYAVRDYYAINPEYGSKDDLHRLIDEAHRRHMKVILDIVAQSHVPSTA